MSVPSDPDGVTSKLKSSVEFLWSNIVLKFTENDSGNENDRFTQRFCDIFARAL